MRLIDKSGKEIKVGDTITDFRGKSHTLVYWKAGSNKVNVVDALNEFNLSVFGLEIDDMSLLAKSLTGETN